MRLPPPSAPAIGGPPNGLITARGTSHNYPSARIGTLFRPSSLGLDHHGQFAAERVARAGGGAGRGEEEGGIPLSVGHRREAAGQKQGW